jgi:beta-N-acetylhexosaminidase
MIEQSPLIIDIAGLELGPQDRARLAHPLVGGMILFARNWRDRRQLTELTASIKSVRDDLLVCVDHEGGRVQRFRTDGFTHVPPMRKLGELWMDDGKRGAGSGAMAATDAASACGFVLASELRACGVDLSFTPVLDLDHGPSGVIGDRAFHRDPRVVTLLAKSVMHGLLQAGMAACGKHFPGHGHVAADSHTDVPVDRRGLAALLADDAAPYGWLSTTLSSVMPAHVIYPKVDPRPAGFSAQMVAGRAARPAGLHRAPCSATTSAWKALAASTAARSAMPTRPWPPWTPAATWCCCATRAWPTAAARSTR